MTGISLYINIILLKNTDIDFLCVVNVSSQLAMVTYLIDLTEILLKVAVNTITLGNLYHIDSSRFVIVVSYNLALLCDHTK